MTPEDWNRLKDLFAAAVERPPAERDAYLREICAGDEALRSELESLLASYAPDDGDAPADPVGQRIGAYQVIRQIGVGGMGAVYLAVRADDTFRKHVAIKVVQAGLASEQIVKRFLDERQILAELDHPNIARLVDGGVTPQGLPYFAMDYVEGERIDRYCARHNLPIAARVRIFRDVCAAVQYVHQNLILHRDLKPGNILVTEEGVPKLLDFGIAKLLKPDLHDLTLAEFRPLTPGYASPEQVRGEPVTTAADVYSLGVILYELLTARSPYRLQTDSPHEIIRAVCEQEPLPPSAAAPDYRRQLAGDLDNIILKALRKEAPRRYASAEQLSQDLDRYLQGLPVSARADTWNYRAGKFIGRHRAGVAAAAFIVLSLAGGVVASTWQARIATRERASAQRSFNDVRKLTTSFLFEFHNAIRNLPGATPARRLLVERALEYLGRLAQEPQADSALQRELAEAYLKVGDVQGDIYGAHVGDMRGAAASYRSALRISRRLVDANPNDVAARRYLARSFKSLGQILPGLGEPSEGLADLRQSTAILETLAAADPANRDLQMELAGSYEVRGDLEGHPGLQNLGDPKAARASYDKALAIYRQLGERKGQAIARIKIADLEMARGTSMQVLQEYRDLLRTLEQISSADPTNAEARRLVAYGYRKVGGVLEGLGQVNEALADYAKAATVNQGLLDADPGNAQAGMSLAITLRYIGDLQAKTGNSPAALRNYQKVLEILDRLSAAEPDNVLVAGRRAEMFIFVADVLAKSGKPDEASRMTTAGLQIASRLAARQDATPDELLEYAGHFLHCTPAALRQPQAAVACARRAVEKYRGPNSDALELLAEAYFQAGDPAHAVEAEQKALSLVPVGNVRGEMEARLARYKGAAHPSRSRIVR